MAFPLQQLEGKYEILEKIAEGGMGAVYKVRHRLLEEIRVIKVMRPQLEHQEEIKSRFLREAKIAVRMRHPNIAQMYDFSIDDAGNSFIVMEYIDGVTLQDLLKRSGPPGVALSLEIAQQSLQALGYLHRKGIIHRDISPDNLMLSEDEVGDPAVKLIDLGIAKPSHGESNLTATGLFLGKIKYASPEHFKASEGVPVDQRSDLYSFGLVLYELLTGVHPVAGSNWSELIAGHLFEKPRDFATTDPDGRIPEELRQVVLTSLTKSPDDRYPDAKAFRRAILHLQTGFPLVREEFERYLKLRERDRAARDAARPSTTQERLDAQFSAERLTPLPTPTPPPGVGAAPPTDGVATAFRDATPAPGQTRQVAVTPASARTHERIRELIDGARRLADLNLHEEAALQARAAQQLDPTNHDVAALLEVIEAGQRRAQLIERRIESIERLIAQESFQDALAELEDSVRELGEAEDFQDLRARIEQLEAQHRFAHAASLVNEAHRLADSQAFSDAIARLEQAEDLDPGNTVVRSHLAEVREAMRAHEQAQRRAFLVAESVDAVEALIAARDYVQAKARLDEALQRCGTDPALSGLGNRIAGLEAAARAERVANLLAQAAAATSNQDLRGAVGLLEQASGVDSQSSEVAERLVAARDALRAREEEERRAVGIADAASEVERLLAADRLAEARARLDQALDHLGLQPPLLALSDRILEAQALERARAVSNLLVEASSHTDVGNHAAAVGVLERALELDPENTTVSSRLAAARTAQDDATRRRQEIARAVTAVDELLTAGEAERAVERADDLTRELGAGEELEAVRARALATRKEQRAARVKQLVQGASSATGRGDHERAVQQLEEAHRLDPDDREVEKRLVAAREARKRREEETRRVVPTPPSEAVPTPGGDRTMAIPTAGVTAAIAPGAVTDRTTTLPVEKTAEAAPPTDRTQAVPADFPKAPEAPKVGPKFKPRGPVLAPTPQPPVERAATVPAAAPMPGKPAEAVPEARPRAIRWALIGGVAAVVVIVVAAIALWPRGGPAPTGPTGTIVINAVPWAEVESIVDARDTAQKLAASSYTPLAVQLPPGRYRISLRNPSKSEPVVVEAEVKVGETSRTPLADFGAIDAATVLGKYGL